MQSIQYELLQLGTNEVAGLLFVVPSLQENTNIEEAARCLVEHILNNEESPMIERDPSTLVLSGYTNTAKDHLNSSCSSCLKW